MSDTNGTVVTAVLISSALKDAGHTGVPALDQQIRQVAFIEPYDCERCHETYDEASGDGWCGLCPACADLTEDAL